MLVSYNWICEIAELTIDPEEMGNRLTFCGLEVEGVEPKGQTLDKIVVGEIAAMKPHPSKGNLSIVEVSSGEAVHHVICGAPNCPSQGGRVVLALPGAQVGDMKIEARKLAGERSEGMLCSELELDLGPQHEGIIVLDETVKARPGTPIADALGLKDWILEIGITPNRPDALSHRGIAREVALLLGRPFSSVPSSTAPEAGRPVEELAQVELLDAAACPRYSASVITGLSIQQSPFNLRYRLHTLGVRPISNIVDVTNLILLEFGQPLHAFDLDRLSQSKIVVRKARSGEQMTTLDEEERTFNENDLLILDGERPVAVAGVMGGSDTGVTEDTKNILLECAYFEPSGIRRTSKRLKLSSESSYRFERGIDPNMGPDVLVAAASLATELAGGQKAPGIIDCYPQPIKPKVVSLRPARFSKLMGFTVEPNEMRRIMEGLGAATAGNEDELEVTIPTSRPDIEREVDLIEEVARIQGLDNVPSTLPRMSSIAPHRPAFESAKKAKEILASLGLEEAINYSFVSEALLKALDMDKQVIQIANPLNAERRAMRTTLLLGLFENQKRAQSRFLPGIRQFEVAKTFHDEGDELPKEVLKAAAFLSGPQLNWVGEEERKVDFFDVKGLVEAFVMEYGGRMPEFQPSLDIACLHPRRACRVLLKGSEIGFVGELHPKILEGFKVARGACVFELCLDKIWSERKISSVTPLSEYPPMVRDVALLIDDVLEAGPIGACLKKECGSLAQEVRLFDVYRGKGIQKGKKSLAFKVVYQSTDRTLTDDEVDALHRAAVKAVLKQFDAVQR